MEQNFGNLRLNLKYCFFQDERKFVYSVWIIDNSKTISVDNT